MKIANGKEYETIAAGDVIAVEILTPDGNLTLHKLYSSDAIDLIHVVGFDRPFIVDGVPAAIVTARLRVHFTASAANLVADTRDFIVWNDRQLEDVLHRGHFYPTQAGLKNLLRMMQEPNPARPDQYADGMVGRVNQYAPQIGDRYSDRTCLRRRSGRRVGHTREGHRARSPVAQ